MVPGDGQPVQMVGQSLTIGRGEANDLVLPDPDRIVSKNHCAIEDHNGNVVVIDFSSNGTFLNYGKVPLGQVPTPLHDGDILSIGGYELVVSITGETQGAHRSDDPMAGLAGPADEGPVSHGDAGRQAGGLDLLDDPGRGGDFLDDLMGTGQGPAGPRSVQRADPADDDGLLPPLEDPLSTDDLLAPAPEPDAGQGGSAGQHSAAAADAFSPRAPAAPLIPEDWDEDLLSPGGGAETIPEPPPPPAAPASGTPPPAAPSAPPSAPPGDAGDPFAEESLPPRARERPDLPRPQTRHPQAAGAAPPGAPQAAAPATPSGGGEAAAWSFLRGAGAGDVPVAAADLPATMERLGRVFALMVGGLREVLMTRTSIKSEFRINPTMISRGANNPLKFSVSAEQAVEALVRPPQRGYLGAEDAAAEALDDIRAHEVAMVTGMQAAIRGVLSRLDPRALEGQIETGGGLTGLLKGRKARYWEVYERLYAQISDQAENDFHDLFAREFARAYQDQLDRLKAEKAAQDDRGGNGGAPQ